MSFVASLRSVFAAAFSSADFSAGASCVGLSTLDVRGHSFIVFPHLKSERT